MCKNSKKFGKKAVRVAVAAILGAAVLATGVSADITSDDWDIKYKMGELIWEANMVLQDEYNQCNWLPLETEDWTVEDYEFYNIINDMDKYALAINSPSGKKRVYNDELYNHDRGLVHDSLHLASFIRLSTDDDLEQLNLREQSVRDRVERIYEGLEELQPIGEEAIRRQERTNFVSWNVFGFDPVKYQEEMEEIEKEFEKSQESSKITTQTEKTAPETTKKSSQQPVQVVTEGKFTAFKIYHGYKDGKVVEERVDVTNDPLPKPVYLYDCYANCIPSYCYGCNLFDTPQVEDGGLIKGHYTKVGDSYKTYSEVCEAVEKYKKEMGLTVNPKTGINFQDIKPPNEVYEDTVYCREKITTQTKKENQKEWEKKLTAQAELLNKGTGTHFRTETSDTGKVPPKEVSKSYPAPTPPGFEVPAALGAAGIAAFFAAKHRKKE